MLRMLASVGLTFGAMAWAVIASIVVFFYGSDLWIGQFGRFGAFWGAVVAFVVALIVAKSMLRLADKLLEPLSGPFDSRAYESAPTETYFRDWRAYAADVVRNRRYAFYMRTRQFDKLHEVEAEIAAARALTQARGGPPPSPPHPTRTTMAGRLTFDENQRGARRTSVQAPKLERWGALGDDEALEADSSASPRASDPGRTAPRPVARAARRR
jgi:hypothetical protein